MTSARPQPTPRSKPSSRSTADSPGSFQRSSRPQMPDLRSHHRQLAPRPGHVSFARRARHIPDPDGVIPLGQFGLGRHPISPRPRLAPPTRPPRISREAHLQGASPVLNTPRRQPNGLFCAPIEQSRGASPAVSIRRSVIVRANYNMPLVAVRDRDERCRSSDRRSSSCPLASLPGMAVPAGLGPVDRQHEPAGSGMSGTRPSRCRVWPGTFPGGRDQRPPQERGDQQPVVPALQQAPGAGDREIGDHWRNHAGCGLQRPLQHGRTAIRRGCRRPGHGHRFPPARAADGTRRVLTPPVPPGQLHLPLPEPSVVTKQGMT
jgi:hypothetical protein